MATVEQLTEGLRRAQAAGNADDVAAFRNALSQATGGMSNTVPASLLQAPQVPQAPRAHMGPTREQLSSAFYAARQAGNEDDARKIIGYIQQQGMTLAPMNADQRNAAFQKLNAANVAAMNPVERFWTGIGEGAHNVFQGVKQQVFDRAADALNIGGRSDRMDRDQANVAEQRRLSQALNATTAGKLGNLAGGVAETLPIALIPGLGEAGIGARMALAGAEGLGLGYVAPAASEGEHRANTLGGLAFGAAAPAAAGLGGRVLSGLATPEARRLIAQGVKPSVGQMLGGTVGRIEAAQTSLPLTGDIIQAARNRGIDTFNRAATNKVLAPIGERIPEGPTLGQHLFGLNPGAGAARVETGQPSMAFAADRASNAFENALGGTRGVFDSQLGRDLASTINGAAPEVRGELADAIQSGVLDRFMANDGTLSGQAFNDLRSDLAKTAVRYRRSESAANRAVGGKLGDVLDSLDAMFERNNGQAAMDALADARRTYGGTMALRDATNAAGRTREGVFTPGEFLGAVKKNDATKGKAAFSRGRARLQDFGNDAQASLGNKVGNSFTFDRMAHGTLGGWASSPIGAPLAAANLPGVRRLLQAILAPQVAPVARGQIGRAIARDGARALVPVGNALLTQPPTRAVQPEPVLP